MKKIWSGALIMVALVRRETFHVMESLTVLTIFGVGMYAAYWIVFGDTSDPRHSRMTDLVRMIDDNWKAFLLLGIPLFYRTIRAFMERVRKVGGVEANEPTEPTETPEQEDIPSGVIGFR